MLPKEEEEEHTELTEESTVSFLVLLLFINLHSFHVKPMPH
jgi:hypothetical protein